MKKMYQLTDPKKHEDRVLEAIKHDIRKYVKREKKKELPNKATMYWDFDCKIGLSSKNAKNIHYDELIKSLDMLKSEGASEVYVEILSKAVDKPIKEEILEINDDINSN